MRNLIKWMITVTVLTVAFVAGTPATKASAQDDYVSYQTFYDDLSPYGQWVSDPQYGDVWVPDVDDDFRPYYTGGHWAMTEYGNMWVSDYNWGWAAFHYGRWTYDPYYGWVWIPGTEWGPAWVSWRGNDNYWGWAPMGPGVTLSMSFGSYNYPDNWWVFVGPQYLYRNDFHRYWRGPGYNTTIIHSTNYYNYNYRNRYAYGPRGDDYYRVTHQRVNVYNVNNGPRPGRTRISGNSVNVYRPQVRSNVSNGQRPRPANAVQAPRPIGRQPQAVVSNTRPEFRTALKSNQVQRVNNNAPQRNQANPAIRPQNTNRQGPAQQQRTTPMPSNRPEQRFDSRPQTQPAPQRVQPAQQPQRSQPMPQQQPRMDNRMDRPQQQQRNQQLQQQRDVQQQQQRNQQLQQQQQREQQVQQRNQQMQQQQQREQQMQQQRNQQMQQQRVQPQQQQQRMERSQPMQAQPQRAQPTMRQEPRQQATPAPRSNNDKPGMRR